MEFPLSTGDAAQLLGVTEPQLAETVRRASLDRLPVDEPMRVALARSRAESPPCAA